MQRGKTPTIRARKGTVAFILSFIPTSAFGLACNVGIGGYFPEVYRTSPKSVVSYSNLHFNLDARVQAPLTGNISVGSFVSVTPLVKQADGYTSRWFLVGVPLDYYVFGSYSATPAAATNKISASVNSGPAILTQTIAGKGGIGGMNDDQTYPSKTQSTKYLAWSLGGRIEINRFSVTVGMLGTQFWGSVRALHLLIGADYRVY